MKIHLLLMLLLGSAWSATAQKMSEEEARYQERIKQSVVNGVYIPANLKECFSELDRKIDKPARDKFRKTDETEAAQKSFFGLGRWIWYNWSFYEGSRLSVHLNACGVHHPEDMSQYIIITYHRYLNHKPLEAEALAEQLRNARAEAQKQRDSKGNN